MGSKKEESGEGEGKSFESEVRFLLFGEEKSGRTTFLKQMKINYDGGFDKEELDGHKVDIRSSIVTGMFHLLQTRTKLSIDWSNEKNGKYADELVGEFPKQKDSLYYYLENLDRISAANYSPTNEDILRCNSLEWKPWIGIHEVAVTIETIPMRFIDIRNQKNERRKWLEWFDRDTIKATIFFAALDAFHENVDKDRGRHGLSSSLAMFKDLSKFRVLKDVNMILILTRVDLLEKKLAAKDLVSVKEAFPEYKGDELDSGQVAGFILNLYKEIWDSANPTSKNLYTHTICTLEKSSVGTIRESLKKARIDPY